MNQETISLKAKSRTETLTFHLRMLTMAEDSAYSERMVQIADKKGKAGEEAKFKAYVEALAAWSVKNPERSTGELDDDGNAVTTLLEGETPADAVKAYFAEITAGKEWMLTSVVGAFRNSLFPAVSFLEPSE